MSDLVMFLVMFIVAVVVFFFGVVVALFYEAQDSEREAKRLSRAIMEIERKESMNNGDEL
jgi:uncharacterized membrane protein